MEHEKLDENTTKNEEFKALCVKCDGRTKHRVLQSIDKMCSLEEDGDGIETVDHYQIIQCQGCETISFRHVNWFSEFVDSESDGLSERLYPMRSETTLETKSFRNAPTEIRRIYRETIDCFNNDNMTLCAAGLRAIVEGICADQGVKDGPFEIKKADGTTIKKRQTDLKGKISGLCEKGILTAGNSKVLHEHRFLGNEAVHQLSQPSTEELRLAIEIVEHTLDSLYEIPEKAVELQRKRVKRTSKP